MKTKINVGDYDMCEAFYVDIIGKMYDERPIEAVGGHGTEVHDTLERAVTLIKVVLQPNDSEYIVQRFGSHVAVDRLKKCGNLVVGTRLLVVGVLMGGPRATEDARDVKNALDNLVEAVDSNTELMMSSLAGELSVVPLQYISEEMETARRLLGKGQIDSKAEEAAK